MAIEQGSGMVDYSITSATLGMVFGGCLVVALTLPGHARLALYGCALVAFHFLEFIMTARFHPESLDLKCTRPC
jgi:hypothetical protein